ncbi:MAG: hypothetical protein GF347_00140 [Candidatus Moranbacteria bacterium]|nr:hypothetical protein [Candidatus Moranbacteria bacterium]
MLVTILFLMLILNLGSVVSNDNELGGGPIDKMKIFQKQEDKKLVFDPYILEKFENSPKLKENCEAKPPIVYSHIGIVIDSKTGKILFAKNENKKVPIASITKVMTALVVYENIDDWSENIKVSKKAAFAGGAGVNLKWGEVMSANNLFKAMLMNSDNSAAIAFAEHISGGTEEFAELMNEKAEELGAKNTFFVEPSGLEDEKAYSTAYDTAMISREALKYKKITEFMRIAGPIEIASADGLLVHRVGNTNLYLRDEAYLSLAPRVIGGKTGFTYNAGYCLMIGLRDITGEKEAIGVILNSDKSGRWYDMEEMIRWSFTNYNW